MKKHLEQAIILLGTFLIAFMGSALNPAIPAIAEEFHMEAAGTGRIVTAYMVTCIVLPVPFARWAQRSEPKKILAAGLGLFTAASLGGIFVPSEWLLFTVRGLQGVGTAMIYSTGMWILISGCTEEDRAKRLSLSSAAMYLGLAAGPAAGGLLNQYLGWQWIFAAAAVVSAAAFSGSLVLLRRCRQEAPGFPPPGKTSPSGRGWLRNLLPRQLFRRRKVLYFYYLASLISCGVNFLLNYMLSLYFQTSLGFSPQKAGFLLILPSAVQALVSIPVGKAAGKGGKRIRHLAASGILGSGAVVAGFVGINGGWPLWLICTGLAAAGGFNALFTAPNTMEIMAAAGKQNLSMASAVISTVRSLGNCVGVVSAGFVTRLVMGQARLSEAGPEALTEVLQITFSFWAALCILGFLMALKKKM